MLIRMVEKKRLTPGQQRRKNGLLILLCLALFFFFLGPGLYDLYTQAGSKQQYIEELRQKLPITLNKTGDQITTLDINEKELIFTLLSNGFSYHKNATQLEKYNRYNYIIDKICHQDNELKPLSQMLLKGHTLIFNIVDSNQTKIIKLTLNYETCL